MGSVRYWQRDPASDSLVQGIRAAMAGRAWYFVTLAPIKPHSLTRMREVAHKVLGAAGLLPTAWVMVVVPNSDCHWRHHAHALVEQTMPICDLKGYARGYREIGLSPHSVDVRPALCDHPLYLVRNLVDAGDLGDLVISDKMRPRLMW